MFSGEVLSATGWKEPAVGDVVACLSNLGEIIWRPIATAETRETECLHVSNAMLRYAITPDHAIPVRIKNIYTDLKLVTGEDILHALNRIDRSKMGVVRWHHTTNAHIAPGEGTEGRRLVVRFYHRAHARGTPDWFLNSRTDHPFRSKLGGSSPNYVPSKLLGETGAGASRLVLATDDAHESPYSPTRECLADVLGDLTPWLRHGPDATRVRTQDRTGNGGLGQPTTTHFRGKQTHYFRTDHPDLVQALLLMNQWHCSTVEGDANALHLWMGNRKTGKPVLPLLSSRTQHFMKTSRAHRIDVKHPFVRLEGKVCVL